MDTQRTLRRCSGHSVRGRGNGAETAARADKASEDAGAVVVENNGGALLVGRSKIMCQTKAHKAGGPQEPAGNRRRASKEPKWQAQGSPRVAEGPGTCPWGRRTAPKATGGAGEAHRRRYRAFRVLSDITGMVDRACNEDKASATGVDRPRQQARLSVRNHGMAA